MNGDRNDKFPLAFICTICYNIIKHSVDAECTCRYSIVVITSVSQTDEAGSIPVICSSAEQARATSRLRSSGPFSCFRTNNASAPDVWRSGALTVNMEKKITEKLFDVHGGDESVEDLSA